MYEIVTDFLQGLLNSCRIDLIIKTAFVEPKLYRLLTKIIKYNFFLHWFPLILVQLIDYFFKIALFGFLYYANYPINIFSALFHLLHYMDLVNMICTKTSKTTNSMAALDTISLALTMTIYQLVMYLTTELIKFIFHDRLYIIALCLNFFILTMYHAFYCYNNLWQYKKIDMFYRIDMHEKLWPYYLGYSTIATFIYLCMRRSYVLGFYNLYMAVLISLPFLTTIKYPPKQNSYPAINLSIFSYITGCILAISKYIIR